MLFSSRFSSNLSFPLCQWKSVLFSRQDTHDKKRAIYLRKKSNSQRVSKRRKLGLTTSLLVRNKGRACLLQNQKTILSTILFKTIWIPLILSSNKTSRTYHKLKCYGSIYKIRKSGQFYVHLRPKLFGQKLEIVDK